MCLVIPVGPEAPGRQNPLLGDLGEHTAALPRSWRVIGAQLTGGGFL